MKTSNSISLYGFYSLYLKEVKRFLNVWLQTLVAPIITTLLFMLVFTLAFNRNNQLFNGVPYLQFLAPGLIAMTVLQNCFSNTSSSIISAKIQGNIFDIIVAPIGNLEFIFAYSLGAVTRGLIIGFLLYVAQGFINGWQIYNLIATLYFFISAAFLLSLLGIVSAIWAVKFDNIALITNFVITPLSFLSGTFYSVNSLSGIWNKLAHIDPFFYLINGVRYGMTGTSDFDILNGAIFILACNLFMLLVTYLILKSGYKLKP